jgi:hypothetical protein
MNGWSLGKMRFGKNRLEFFGMRREIELEFKDLI